MADQVSFKTRVKDTAISIAPDYYSYYVCRDYLLISLIPKEDAESGSKSPNNKNLQSEIK